MEANDALLVAAADFSADAFRLLELNADVERAIAAGDRCAAGCGLHGAVTSAN